MGKLDRKYLAHYINGNPASGINDTSYERLGNDLEELSVELNPETETKNNILGGSSTNISKYNAQYSVEPYYADSDTKLYEFLQDIIDNRKVLDNVKTDVLEVQLWNETGLNTNEFIAYRDKAMIEINSYGGDYQAYQIPFTVHLLGERTKGTFNTTTKIFTPDTGELAMLNIKVVAGTTSTKTQVSDVIGNATGTLKYKVADTLYSPVYGASDTGYTELSKNTDITCASTNKIIVIESSSDNEIISASEIKNVVVGS